MSTVRHTHETKPIGGKYDRQLETDPLLRIEELADLFDGSATAPYFEKRAGHPSHHSAKEGRTNHVHPHLVSNGAYIEEEELPPSVFHPGV